MYELFIENFKVDIDQKLSVQLTFAIDDIANYGSRETSFSKTIVLPGTGRNNQIFGFIYDIASYNYEAPGSANIGSVFNAAQTSRAELRLNGLLVLKGVFRITNIIKDKDIIEYEGALFGELAGFIANIGRRKLEDLDFSAYNHTYTRDNIVNSWNTVNGSGYYYPLIDHGTYSTPEKNNSRTKIDYDYRTFRPALYVKEYIDKIFSEPNSDYRYQSDFINSDFFRRLIVPNNFAKLTKLVTDLLNVNRSSIFNIEDSRTTFRTYRLPYTNIILTNNFTGNGNPNFVYTGPPAEVEISFAIKGHVNLFETNGVLDVRLRVGEINRFVRVYSFINNLSISFNESVKFNVLLNTNDTVYVLIQAFNTWNPADRKPSAIEVSSLSIKALNPVTADLGLNDPIIFNSITPRNITQKDFFTWILKMFNLYVVEDKFDNKLLHIIPYKDFLDSDIIDWTNKIARDKPWQIKPMGLLNSRFFEYKYKEDNDFYNESYKKKYNLPYGSNLQDTQFEFAKDKQTIEIGFSPTVLIQYDGADQSTKVLPAIYKKSSGNAVDQEERMDSNIRILMAKKITADVASWYITNNDATGAGRNLGDPLTAYGYAGHFDDPLSPTVDINFGANAEIYFDPATYPTANLFNTYWSGYIAEIVDKDSKLLSCHARLTPLDIAQLDFSKPIMIDGVLFRLNKIDDYDYRNDELVKVELLKIINYFSCAQKWTKQNYTGTRFRNGDEIPQVTGTTAWANLTTPAWCYYNNDPASEEIYGKLYNWYAINDPRGFAPDGYRMPSDSDWDSLVNCLGGASVAGGKLKSTGTQYWNEPNIGATNESRFNALPGGFRNSSGGFEFVRFTGSWWTSTEFSSNNALFVYIDHNFDDITKFNTSKKRGFSVRLIKE